MALWRTQECMVPLIPFERLGPSKTAQKQVESRMQLASGVSKSRGWLFSSTAGSANAKGALRRNRMENPLHLKISTSP